MSRPQPWAAFYRLMRWLEKKIRDGEVPVQAGQWYCFSCMVRWNDEEQVLEADVPALQVGDRFGHRAKMEGRSSVEQMLRYGEATMGKILDDTKDLKNDDWVGWE